MIFTTSLEISQQYKAQLGYPPISWPFGLRSGLYVSHVVTADTPENIDVSPVCVLLDVNEGKGGCLPLWTQWICAGLEHDVSGVSYKKTDF